MMNSIGLYPQLLEAVWHELAPAVQLAHLHDGRQSVRGRGTFEVRHARWALPLLWLMRMPAAGTAVAVELTVTRVGSREIWQRCFAGRPMVTTQEAGAAGELVECLGCTELRFRLEVIEGTLVYRQTGARFRLGRLAIPLPLRLSPRVRAREQAADGPARTQVHIEISLPFVGMLMSYGGDLQLEVG